MARMQDDEEITRAESPLLGNARPAQTPPSSRSRNRLWSLAAIMIFVSSFLLLYFLFGQGHARPVNGTRPPKTPLVAKLEGYGTFRGTQVVATLKSGTAFNQPVDAWLGIDYARQPVGEYRFAPPDWPAEFNGTKDANQYGPVCIQDPQGTSLPQSEACLNFNVFRTSGIPPSQRLPVFAFIHGGSFVGGSGRSFDGATFVAASKKPIVVVTFQYRLGALGSLPSKLFEEEGLLNVGLLDQRLMLEFLQYYIPAFGGDRTRITLGGQSAGGHSVGIHLFHDYSEDTDRPLFSQAILASGSPTARAFPEVTYPLYQRQFSEFMTYLGCPESPNDAALNCLRSIDISYIQYIQASMYRASEYNITWPFQPVSPGPLLEKRGSQSGFDGTFFKVPILISSTTDEGKLFAPQDLVTSTQFRNFIGNVNIGLTKQDLDDLELLYPDPVNPASLYADSPQSFQYNRISAAYGDYSYICPVQETARLLAQSSSVYKARFNTPNYAPDWQGVPHASDAAYFNGIPNAEFPDVSVLYASYFASFVVCGDPNTYAIAGAPRWAAYEAVGGQELVVGSGEGVVGTAMENEGDGNGHGVRLDTCKWWRDPDRMKRLRK